MTGRTHDLAAFTTLTYVFVSLPLKDMSLATLIVAIGANFFGGLFPDIDNASSDLWDKVRGGSIWGKIVAPLIGGHRMISHSLLGLFFTGWLLNKFLLAISQILIVDMTIVWWAFMIGYVSHLVTDGLTKEGLPLLFPIPLNIGFPPIKALRLKTGGLLEKSLVFPGLIIINGILIYHHHSKILDFLRHHLK